MMQTLPHMKANGLPVILISLFTSFAVLQLAQAVSPPPDGGYPDGNTAEGDNALLALTDGGFNTAVGFYSLASVSSGQHNTAIGAGTLVLNTGNQNTATGAGALFSNSDGDRNTGTGAFALSNNTTGADNTAVGASVLASNTEGSHNTAIGVQTMKSNVDGNSNVAVGDQTLLNNIEGVGNAAVGVQALYSKTEGGFDTAMGSQALLFETTADDNTAIGAQALIHTTTGKGNTALGHLAGFNLTTGDYNIDIGNLTGGVAGESRTTRIGKDQTRAFMAGIHGVTTGNNNAIPVVIDSDGQLGTMSSSREYKIDIKPIAKTSESILALKPVSFRYKAHSDFTPNFGLIAEEVAKVNPDLVIYDADGKPFTIRYEAVNAMLLNEFLKEHRKVHELETNAARQQKQIAALTAGLLNVSAQLELNKPAPRTVLNGH